jgi:hypothetical protein
MSPSSSNMLSVNACADEEIEKRCDHRKVGQRNDYNLGHRTSGRVNPETLSRKRRQFHSKSLFTSGRFGIFLDSVANL